MLNRKLLKSPLKELFGPSGRLWILAQHHADIERLMLDNDLAHLGAVEAAHCMANGGAPLTASYHRLRRKKSHNVAVVALARKLVVVAWHLLRHQEPYRYAPARRTRAKLRRVSPDLAAAKAGCVPSTIGTGYAEIGLPEPRRATAGERRAAEGRLSQTLPGPGCTTR